MILTTLFYSFLSLLLNIVDSLRLPPIIVGVIVFSVIPIILLVLPTVLPVPTVRALVSICGTALRRLLWLVPILVELPKGFRILFILVFSGI
jgi:hypothetical protein